MPQLGDIVETAHGPGRVEHVYAGIAMEPDGARIGYMVTAALDTPYTGDNHQLVRRLETIVPLEHA